MEGGNLTVFERTVLFSAVLLLSVAFENFSRDYLSAAAELLLRSGTLMPNVVTSVDSLASFKSGLKTHLFNHMLRPTTCNTYIIMLRSYISRAFEVTIKLLLVSNKVKT